MNILQGLIDALNDCKSEHELNLLGLKVSESRYFDIPAEDYRELIDAYMKAVKRVGKDESRKD